MEKAFAAWLMLAAAATGPQSGPRETVETAVVRVVGAFQGAEAAGRVQTDQVAEARRVARGLFDYDEVTRRVLSRHWSARTPEEQTEFVGLFTRLLEGAYLNQLEGCAGGRIVYTSETIDGIYATVRSRVTMGRSDVGIDYRMHLRDGRWRVYDAVFDGMSLVSIYRSQFDRVIQAESYEALVERLRKRTIVETQVRN